VAAGAPLDGLTLKAAELEIETGFYLLAIRRAGRYLYRPQAQVRIAADGQLIGIGPDEGQARLAQLCGYRILEDDDTGEIELVPVASGNSH
jgi:uncharacterized protein with PhoU and TrkA domain